MKFNYPWLPQVLFEGEDGSGGGADTTPGTAGDDTVQAGSPDDKPLIGEDTATDTVDDKPLIGEDTTEGEFNSDPIEFKEETIAEDLKDILPEGFEVDPAGMKEFLDAMNGAESRADMIKAALDIYSKYQTTAAEQQQSTWADTQKEWKAETRAHPEYGGSKFEESASNAKLVAKTYGGKEFLNLLAITGAGNHPAMMAFLNKVHEVVPTEGGPITGDPNTGDKSLADRLFGGS